MIVIITAFGALLVLVALRDVFDTLFHPHGRGVVSETLIRAVWRITRGLVRGNHRVLSLAGPVAFIGGDRGLGGLGRARVRPDHLAAPAG